MFSKDHQRLPITEVNIMVRTFEPENVRFPLIFGCRSCLPQFSYPKPWYRKTVIANPPCSPCTLEGTMLCIDKWTHCFYFGWKKTRLISLGKLVFPKDYPFKPPSIRMLTPNGRFQIDTRLCLSMSDFHPGTWNPSWSVATILNGLLSFMVRILFSEWLKSVLFS